MKKNALASVVAALAVVVVAAVGVAAAMVVVAVVSVVAVAEDVATNNISSSRREHYITCGIHRSGNEFSEEKKVGI